MNARPHPVHSNQQQQDAAVRALVERETLTDAQASAVRAALGVPSAPNDGAGKGRRLPELAGYVGGGLILAASLRLVGQAWGAVDRPARVVLLATATLIVLTVAAAIGGGTPAALRALGGLPAAVRRRLFATILALAAATAGVCAGAAAVHHAALAGGAAALIVAAAGYTLVRTPVGLVATWLAGAVLTGAITDVAGLESSRAYGVAYVAYGAVWAAAALQGWIREQSLGLAVAAAAALVGAQLPVSAAPGWGYLLTSGVALACLAGYLVRRSWVLIAAGAVGVTLVVPEAVFDWTNGALGGAGILLVAGLSLLTASMLGLRLHRGSVQPG